MAARQTGAQHSARLPLLLVAPIAIFVIVFLVAQCAGSVLGDASQDRNPFTAQSPFAAPVSAAASAADEATGTDQAILRRIAEVPTAVWLTPEAYPADQVGGVVSKTVEESAAAGRAPVFVVYGITNRDCSGLESSGGLQPDEYTQWVERIAEAAGSQSTVILEPDALATSAECAEGQRRIDLLREAVDELTDRGPIVYVDAGHASWIDPVEMAKMLTSVGVDDARGFSTNVAGYESTDDEKAYADAIVAQLGNAHYVIDTSRNGLGSNGEWCNPSGRALGSLPQAVGEGALDAYLWVKPPGESDGECGGGPPAGTFWTERALELAANAGW